MVHTLQQLQAVQCVRQQSNEADPDAVSVLTLAGACKWPVLLP